MPRTEEQKEKHREYMRALRALQKEKNPKEFLEKQRNNRRINRGKSVDDPVIKRRVGKKEDVKKIKDELKISTEPLVDKGHPVSEKTITRYIENVTRLRAHMSIKGVFSTSFLKNTNKVSKFIEKEYPNKNTQMTYFKSIVSLARRIGLADTIVNVYSKKMMKIKHDLDRERGENKMSQKEKKNFLDWDDLKNFEDPDWTPKERLIHSLYTSIPPRRLEYRDLVLIGKGKNIDIDDLSGGNLVVTTRRGLPTKIVLHSYKTSKTYGKYTLMLGRHNDEYHNLTKLRNDIENYIKHQNLESDDFFFTKTERENFTNVINKVFKKTGKKISVDILRQSFASQFNDKKLTSNQLKQFSKEMGHSKSEFLNYRKFKE